MRWRLPCFRCQSDGQLDLIRSRIGQHLNLVPVSLGGGVGSLRKHAVHELDAGRRVEGRVPNRVSRRVLQSLTGKVRADDDERRACRDGSPCRSRSRIRSAPPALCPPPNHRGLVRWPRSQAPCIRRSTRRRIRCGSRPARESRRARACNGPCRRSASCRPTSEIRPDRSCASRELRRRVRPRAGHGRSAAARLLSCRRGAHRVPSLDLEQCDAFSKPRRTSYGSSAFSSPWAVCLPEALLEPIILSSRKINKVAPALRTSGTAVFGAKQPPALRAREVTIHAYRGDARAAMASMREIAASDPSFESAITDRIWAAVLPDALPILSNSGTTAESRAAAAPRHDRAYRCERHLGW